MVHPKVLLSLFCICSFLAGSTLAKRPQNDFIIRFCSNSGNYTKPSLFQTNLEAALSINTTDINYGFYNFSNGQNADRVDVIGLCRGDVKPSSCHSCLDDLSDDLQQSCPNQKEAIEWSDDCMIRYANRSLLSNTETGPMFYAYNLNNASDPTRFNKAVRGLLDDLRAKAAAGGSMIKYATGKTNLTQSSEEIFGLVQCTPDLSPEKCSECLNGTFSILPQCCDGRIGGRVLSPSCNFRYEINQFYNQTPMSNAPAPAPVPQAAASPNNGQIATPPASFTPAGGLPPPQGGGNKHLAFYSLATILAVVPTILIL